MDGWGGGGMSGGEKEMIEAINISSILIKASLWNKSMLLSVNEIQGHST